MPYKRLTAPVIALILVLGGTGTVWGSPPPIGMASAQSGVKLDNSQVSGNATLFDGSMVETQGYSRIHLNNGTRLDLAAGSRARVFANRASLESGMSEIQSATGFELDALTLKIRPAAANSIARVKVDADHRVLVTALNAPVNVLNQRGLLVARVNPGLPLSFLPQAGSPNAFDNTGCVVQKQGAAILVDQTGNQTFELRGADLRKAVGNVTHILGTTDSSATPAAGASGVVNVSRAAVVGNGGCSKIAAGMGATTSAAGLGSAATGGNATAVLAGGAVAAGAVGAATAAGLGASTSALIVGGVAAATAAAIGAAAASGGFTQTSP